MTFACCRFKQCLDTLLVATQIRSQQASIRRPKPQPYLLQLRLNLLQAGLACIPLLLQLLQLMHTALLSSPSFISHLQQRHSVQTAVATFCSWKVFLLTIGSLTSCNISSYKNSAAQLHTMQPPCQLCQHPMCQPNKSLHPPDQLR